MHVASTWADVYRAIDEQGQIVDGDVSTERSAADAAACLRRAIEAPGVAPTAATTDAAAAYPPALEAALPDVLHETGTMPRQRIVQEHQHRKGRRRGMRGGGYDRG